MAETTARMGRPRKSPEGDTIVARLRALKGWSQVEAAEALGVGQPSISAYETGKARIPAPVRKLAAALLGEPDA